MRQLNWHLDLAREIGVESSAAKAAADFAGGRPRQPSKQAQAGQLAQAAKEARKAASSAEQTARQVSSDGQSNSTQAKQARQLAEKQNTTAKQLENGDMRNVALVWMVITLNGYRSILFLDRAGLPTLMIIVVMTVLILLQRSGELHPLLAAGIPMYRILRPLIFACVGVNALLMFNQEFLVQRRVVFLEHEIRHGNDPSQSQVESVTDHSTQIWIDGARVNVAENKIIRPSFALPWPTLVNDFTILEAETAKYIPASRDRPAGWLLKNVMPIEQHRRCCQKPD